MTDDRGRGPLLQIGQVAEATGLSLKTIRHYDEMGLVAPSERSPGGFRLYTPADVERLLVIRRMKPLGFTLEQMRDLLAALDTLADPQAPAGVRGDAALFVDQCSDAAHQRCAELRDQLAIAEEFADTLAGAAARHRV
ncbi:MerR family transcriptional regulator [Tsukamurella pulmonis]|uniref:DNA-binding transcriptional regulator, MerR family n=1 Tax=Tsukamurella pulmonis TaxID=47312 RepID=A0A1H1GSU5_9ACTN|nr:MerR family transcriptional regulator [Tsukamurella pulmonis]KXO88269.1 MerR family transcriptional regulator [Tsukamurella pulmonis]KXP13245.1 MerR family transcriptional regulator [Tsukamurella pulmonis]RDH13824.1 MerR family transcriptional regulator [Tsukamurella pulmonis]SDR16247.1 DNA-binding transcriptional regulator, MerR family [Tsukamurella pulmonis]SUP16705.1 Mercuric resistance operon regulatory protein [Tsukamurella pulmonis]